MKADVPYIPGYYQDEHPLFNGPEGLARNFASGKEKQFFRACEELIDNHDAKAESILTGLLGHNPAFQEARFLLGAIKISKQQWVQAQSILLPLTGREYFIGYWIFRFLPSFRLMMKVDSTFWLPILPRTEELLLALGLLRRYQGDEDSCMSIVQAAHKKYLDNMGLRIVYASLLMKRNRDDDALNILNATVRKRQDDMAVLFRFFRGLALVNKGDARSGFYQMESALDLSGHASPYLKENIRYRIFEKFYEQNFLADALTHLNLLEPSIATNIPDSFDQMRIRNEIISKLENYAQRGIQTKISLLDSRPKSDHGEDYWEVK